MRVCVGVCSCVQQKHVVLPRVLYISTYISTYLHIYINITYIYIYIYTYTYIYTIYKFVVIPPVLPCMREHVLGFAAESHGDPQNIGVRGC